MSVLCVIVDCNACAWASLFEQQNQLAETANLLSVSISSIVSFCSAHLAQNSTNRLVLFAAAVGVSSQPLFSDLMTSDDTRRTMAIGLRSSFNASANSTNVEMGIPLASMVALSLCHIARVRNECPNADARILVLTVSEETSGDEKRLMNLFFTAHKQQIIVDVAAIGMGKGFALLQQAADITGGVHVSVNSPRSLLNHLLIRVQDRFHPIAEEKEETDGLKMRIRVQDRFHPITEEKEETDGLKMRIRVQDRFYPITEEKEETDGLKHRK